MAHPRGVHVLRRAPATFRKLGIAAYAILTQHDAIGAALVEGHLDAFGEEFAGADDGVGFCVGAAFLAVRGVLGEIFDRGHGGG